MAQGVYLSLTSGAPRVPARAGEKMLQKRTKPSVPKLWEFGDRVPVPHPAVSLSAQAPVCRGSGGDTVLGRHLWAGPPVTTLGSACPFPTSHL